MGAGADDGYGGRMPGPRSLLAAPRADRRGRPLIGVLLALTVALVVAVPVAAVDPTPGDPPFLPAAATPSPSVTPSPALADPSSPSVGPSASPSPSPAAPSPSPSPSPSVPVPTASASPSASPTPTATASAAPSPTPTPTVAPTPSPTPSGSPGWPTMTWPTAPTTLGSTVTFYGRGYGHGVGLSQYGAKGRAQAGQTSMQILAAYFRGVKAATVSATQ